MNIANKTIWAGALLTAMFLCPFSVFGQTAEVQTQAQTQIRFGYLSNDAVIKQMPQYAEVQKNMANLKAQYEAEAKRSEEDFQQRFTQFLEGQKSFPQSILEKRQNDLQSMLETTAAFRVKVQGLLADAESDMMADLKAILHDAIQTVAQEGGYDIILNTDGEGVSFITPGMATDVTEAVLIRLGVKGQETQPSN